MPVYVPIIQLFADHWQGRHHFGWYGPSVEVFAAGILTSIVISGPIYLQ